MLIDKNDNYDTGVYIKYIDSILNLIRVKIVVVHILNFHPK